ncbi:MAG: phosphoribosylglycinamide formyltransferase [Clostridia bacterium]|nr:phosphoribosylglycinamide formyltransferase [Clostridia bacterium]
MLKVGVLVSGGGTNLQAIIDKIESGYIKNCSIAAVVSSKPGTYAMVRAERRGIPAECVERKSFASIDEFDQALIDCLEKYEVDLVVLAGFLSILGQRFNQKYAGRVINVHPALIPSFSGKGYYGLIPHQKALEYGVKLTGATVHFVELEADAGPIILQKAVCIKEDDTPETLQKRVMEEVEWDILPEAIKLFAEDRLRIEGRKVRILPEKD